MARGAIAKEEITKKIFEVFPNAFIVGKDIRIPINENGETVEIKIALTCAKDVIGGGDQVQSNVATPASAPLEPPTEEEVKEVRNLIEELGL